MVQILPRLADARTASNESRILSISSNILKVHEDRAGRIVAAETLRNVHRDSKYEPNKGFALSNLIVSGEATEEDVRNAFAEADAHLGSIWYGTLISLCPKYSELVSTVAPGERSGDDSSVHLCRDGWT
jgi:hypothetical protein